VRYATGVASAGIAWAASLVLVVAAGSSAPAPQAQSRTAAPAPLFDTSHNCMACHNGLATSAGEDISIGVAWRATMMANSARDPYWQAAVRREILDHPTAAAEIQHECSICHMPMSTTNAIAMGRRGEIFAHLPIGQAATPDAALAADGVSCTACHQITADKLGTPESFTGGFVIDTTAQPGGRAIYGPYPVAAGLTGLMHSATGFRPVESAHVRQSEVCATCHTLYTHPLRADGTPVGTNFPEQVPYLEWRNSDYRESQSCQACHMPLVEEPARIASVLGEPREGVRRHSFRGGNFFMLGMLNRYRTELGVEASPQELDAAVRETLNHLARDSARLEIARAERVDGRLVLDVSVENLSGHKLPTAYPSRRAWIHLVVRDGSGRVVFESGAIERDGSIRGNDNDADGATFEPHYQDIRAADQVQIYEAVMSDEGGAVTTGLLKAVRYLKDNRLLPRGFDRASASPDIAVRGDAANDPDFTGGSDRVRYSLEVPAGALNIEATLRFQPIAFRWAKNLEAYDAPEPRRFLGYYDAMAGGSSAVLATATAAIR
jgi:hypothetical protein